MSSRVVTAALTSSAKWIWPSIACVSIGALAYSEITNTKKCQSSLQQFETEMGRLRKLVQAQEQSIKRQQRLMSSSNPQHRGTGSYASIAKTVSPSIVNLVIEGQSTVNMGFFQIQQPTTMLGTGVIIRSDGIVVTNNHCVTNPADLSMAHTQSHSAESISVYLSNSRKLRARVLLRDELNDLALLQIENENDELFPSIEIGDASTVEVGDRVLAVGNNLGLRNTVTDGIISAIGRAQASRMQFRGGANGQVQNENAIRIGNNPYLPFLQTNAAINQGSSGGALIDIESETLIGINTAIISPIGVNIGVGFAIPSSYVASLLRSLDAPYWNQDKIVRPWYVRMSESVS